MLAFSQYLTVKRIPGGINIIIPRTYRPDSNTRLFARQSAINTKREATKFPQTTACHPRLSEKRRPPRHATIPAKTTRGGMKSRMAGTSDIMNNVMMASPKVHTGSSLSHRSLWPSAKPMAEQYSTVGRSHTQSTNVWTPGIMIKSAKRK